MNEGQFEICVWCQHEIQEGTVHLPESIKGRCAVAGTKVEGKTHPVGMIASTRLAELMQQISTEILNGIKEKYGNDTASLVLNWNIAVMNFCSLLMMRTIDIQMSAAAQAFEESKLRDLYQN